MNKSRGLFEEKKVLTLHHSSVIVFAKMCVTRLFRRVILESVDIEILTNYYRLGFWVFYFFLSITYTVTIG